MNFRCAITVSLVPQAKGGPFVFWDGLEDACRHAKALGFHGIEIFPPSAEAVDRAALRGLLEKHGLVVAAIGTGGGWVAHQLTLTSPDAAVREKALAFIRGIIDLAGEFGAPAIIGSMQGRWTTTREEGLALLGDALEELGEHAARHGQPLLYEPLNRYETNFFNRQGDCAAWLRTLKTKNVRILADLFHMNIEEADLAAAIRDAAPLIGHVHFADSNRRAIGMGHTDVRPVIAALLETGYAGWLSGEILPLPDSAAAARQTIESFHRHA